MSTTSDVRHKVAENAQGSVRHFMLIPKGRVWNVTWIALEFRALVRLQQEHKFATIGIGK